MTQSRYSVASNDMWKYFILNQKLSETDNYFFSLLQIQTTSVASQSLCFIFMVVC